MDKFIFFLACAIECYACEYPGSDWCNDPFNEDNVPENGKMPCGDAQCLKAVAGKFMRSTLLL